MKMPLKQFRTQYRDTLLSFLWREWTALGVAGADNTAPRHVADPEAQLLFTCTLGRHDQRLFDEVMDWLLLNGRFINIQRLRNILAKEDFRGGPVLSAVADWLTTRGASSKWKLLAKQSLKGASALTTRQGHDYRVKEEPDFAINYQLSTINSLFFLPSGRPMPQSRENDPLFLRHGFQRNPVKPRGYSLPFATDTTAARLLKLRALFGVNARCDILDYLARNGTGYPREIARELYYAQKTVHDTLTDLAASGVIQSSKGTRERVFRITPGSFPFLDHDTCTSGWINWSMLLSAAEQVWNLTEGLCAREFDLHPLEAEVIEVMELVFDRLNRARWLPGLASRASLDGLAQLHTFQSGLRAILE